MSMNECKQEQTCKIMLTIKIESETGVIGECAEVMIYRIRVGIVGRIRVTYGLTLPVIPLHSVVVQCSVGGDIISIKKCRGL